MTKTFRVGVLGLTHDHVWSNLQQLRSLTNAEVVAAADPHEGLLSQFKGDFPHAATYFDYEELCESVELDAVYVFSDNASSVELARWAADLGLHILLEKPMAPSLRGADALLAAVRSARVRLMINWPFCWWPALQEALRLASTGAIGEIWQVKYRAAHEGPAEHGCSEYFCDWLYDAVANGGGAMMDYSGYGIALAIHLLGTPHRVWATHARLQKETIFVEDNALVVMKYPRAMAIAEASWTQIGKLTSYVTAIYGTEGTLLVEPPPSGKLLRADADHPQGESLPIPDLPSHHQTASSHFLWGLETGQPFYRLCQDRVCRDIQEILEAAYISAESGQEVSLPLPLQTDVSAAELEVME